MEAIGYMHDAFHLFALEKRVDVEIAKEDRRKFLFRRDGNLEFANMKIVVCACACNAEDVQLIVYCQYQRLNASTLIRCAAIVTSVEAITELT